MKRICIINGSGGVGKDTFVSFCAYHAKVENYSSVTEIKEIAKLLGWTGSKQEKDRKFLSDLKLLTTDYSDFPYRCIEKKIREFKENEKDILFIHIRDIPEIKKVVENYPEVETLLITNHNVPHITSNIADANVNNYDYDYIINNDDSLETLEYLAYKFVINPNVINSF